MIRNYQTEKISSKEDRGVDQPQPFSKFQLLKVQTFSKFEPQLVERQSAVREVEGSSPRPDEHSGS